MTVVEKAAYLKGLTEGLGVEPDSREGKLWGALNDLLGDMAREIEELHQSDADFADTLDELGDELAYLEELTADLDMPEDGEYEKWDDDDDGDDGDNDNDDEDEELDYDGILYDVTCPGCGEEITFDEDTLLEGSIKCPKCGEKLEFDMTPDDDEEIKF